MKSTLLPIANWRLSDQANSGVVCPKPKTESALSVIGFIREAPSVKERSFAFTEGVNANASANTVTNKKRKVPIKPPLVFRDADKRERVLTSCSLQLYVIEGSNGMQWRGAQVPPTYGCENKNEE